MFSPDQRGEQQALAMQMALVPRSLQDYYGPSVYDVLESGGTGPFPLGLPLPPVSGTFVNEALGSGMTDMMPRPGGPSMGPPPPPAPAPATDGAPGVPNPGRRYHTLEKAQSVNAGKGFGHV